MKFWIADSIPIYGKKGVESLVKRLNQLEEKGFTIEGMEFYGKDKWYVMIISSRERTEEELDIKISDITIIEDDEQEMPF